MSPAAPVYVLGLSAYYHDSAACLLRDGEIVAAAQEERFTRKRHDASFPTRAVAWCLAEAGIDARRLDHVCFYDKPVSKFARLVETHVAMAPRGLRAFLTAMPVWLRQKLWTAREVEDALPDFEGEVLFTEHHQAHAASAFFASPFDQAAVLTLDGVGEWTTSSAGIGRGNALEFLREMRFPHSLGLLYSAFTYHAGFRVNSGEYKLMGLAPYGEPRYRDRILAEVMDLKADGSFRLDQSFFDYAAGLKMTSARFDARFDGPPRAPESPLTQREMDLAASVQAVTEEVVLRMCRDLHTRTGLTDLCLAGGVALNCVANGKILRGDTGFRRLWVQPAAGDAGGALGAALATWHTYLDRPRVVVDGRDAMRGAPSRINGDGTPMRSYLYASDLAIWLWTILFKAPHARAYNVGSDEDISIKNLADIVVMAHGGGLPLKLAVSPQSGCCLLRYVPSINRASEELALRIRINLVVGINKTIIWNE